MLPKRTDLNGVFEVFSIFHLNLDWIDWMSSFINTSVAPQRSGLSQVLIHQSSGPSWTPRVYYCGRSLKCFCHIYRQRQRFRGNMISCGVMDRTFLWRSCRLFILSRATREKNCEITLSCEPTDSHLSAASVQYFSFSYSQKFFLTFFFNFLKTKMALVVCTRRNSCTHSSSDVITADQQTSTTLTKTSTHQLFNNVPLSFSEGFKK